MPKPQTFGRIPFLTGSPSYWPGGYWLEDLGAWVCFTSIMTGAKFLVTEAEAAGFLRLHEVMARTGEVQLTGHVRLVDCKPQRVRTDHDTHQEEDGIVWVGDSANPYQGLLQWAADAPQELFRKRFNAFEGEVEQVREELAGKSLSTSLDLSAPSHADWLLEMANFSPV